VTDVPEADDPVLRAIGVASWDALSSRHAQMCSVESDGTRVTVVANTGDDSGGFTPEPSTERKVETSPELVGKAVLAAFGSAA
jgi:hypothetical protein